MFKNIKITTVNTESVTELDKVFDVVEDDVYLEISTYYIQNGNKRYYKMILIYLLLLKTLNKTKLILVLYLIFISFIKLSDFLQKES